MNEANLSTTAKSKAFNAIKNEKALNEFINEMMPFIYSCSKPYLIEEFKDDMLNVARMAFVQAIKRFDYSMNGFVEYTKKAIEMDLKTFISNDTRLICIPRYVSEKKRRIKKAIDNAISSGKEITKEEIMKFSKISSRMTFDNICKYSKLSQPISYDIPLAKGDNTLECYIPSSYSVEDDIIDEIMNNELKKSIKALNETDRYILVHLFGLGGSEKMNKEEIAKELDIPSSLIGKRKSIIMNELRERLSTWR